jgi:DNA-binding NtrC family response regulator
MPSILIIDDEYSIRESFSLILEDKYQIFLAASGEAGLKIAADKKIDLVFLDVRMPGLNGLETLNRLKQIDPDLEVVMVTAVNDMQKASEAVHSGARDYVVKPFDVDHILKLAEQILRRKILLQEGNEIQKSTGQGKPELIGQTEKIVAANYAIEKLKPNQRVLIIGEAGTEKKTVARLIHAKSPRADLPFRHYSFFPQLSLIHTRTRLFGSGQGESTVNISAQSGLFEQAKNGSVFLNNLEAMPAELFGTITSLHFARQGSTVEQPIEARLLGGASTEQAVSKDVFEFFSEAIISLPPLRERPGDIPTLIDYFLAKYNKIYNKNLKFNDRISDILSNYDWPGNVRQLENLIARLVLCTEQVEPQHLPLELLLETAGSSGREFVDNFESNYVNEVLALNGEDRERTAAWLDIKPQVLDSLLPK